jgi:hypothetical protein
MEEETACVPAVVDRARCSLFFETGISRFQRLRPDRFFSRARTPIRPEAKGQGRGVQHESGTRTGAGADPR